MYTYTYPGRIQKQLYRFLFAAGSLLVSSAAFAGPFFFSTGTVTNSIASASRPGPGSGGSQETESADDFLLGTSSQINSATFTGLLPTGASVRQVVVEIYRVFPNDSDTTRTGSVPPFST